MSNSNDSFHDSAPLRQQKRLVSANIILRVLLCFAVLTLLLLLIAISGRMALRESQTATDEVVLHDARVSERGLEILTSTLELRRYEKDIFLNIGQPARQAEYKEKWEHAKADLETRVAALDQLITGADDHMVLFDLRTNVTTYTDGFERVSADAMGGKVATPQEANRAMEAFKGAVHAIEETSFALGATSAKRDEARVALLAAESDKLILRLNAIGLASLLFAVVLALAVVSVLRSVVGEEVVDFVPFQSNGGHREFGEKPGPVG